MTTDTPIPEGWAAVEAAAAAERGITLNARFEADAARASRMRIAAAGVVLHYGRARIGEAGLAALEGFAERAELSARMAALFAGERVNATEGRAAWHTALRRAEPPVEAASAAEAARRFAEEVRADGTEAVLWLGIGGSDLGPRLVVDALEMAADGPEIRFVSNVDGAALDRALSGLDPAKTRLTVASKSFSTQETMINARAARAWLADALGPDEASRRTAAVTANPERAEAFGVDPAAVFPLFDWVGGRFSVWSTVGLPIRLALGNPAFDAFLAGARAMDDHVAEAPFRTNMAMILAALDLWSVNALGLGTLAVVPYAGRLRLFVPYLQQLIMESNGKGVAIDGAPLALRPAPVIWGAPGTDAQHSFFQWLHQAPTGAAVEFLLPVRPADERPENQRTLAAHCLAQGSALALGRDLSETRAAMAAEGADTEAIDALAAHRVFPGDRPSVTLLFDDVTPRSLGALIALYEHRVAAQAALLGINAFDQWGVEFGKTLANRILPALASEASELSAADPATAALLADIRDLRR